MKVPFRRLVFWLHLAVGCTAAIVVLVMTVTGTLLTFEQQLVEWAERDVRSSSSVAAPVPLEALVAGAAASQPGARPTSLVVRADPAAPAQVGFGRERTVLVDRTTGAVLGEGAPRMRAAMRTLTAWHRWLGATGEHRELGGAITGAANLGFLFLVVSGIYLWLPRAWTRAAVRTVAWFRGGLRGKARDFNWHNVLGLWAAVPLLLIVFSGVVISYNWASDLVVRLASGSEGTAPAPPRPPAKGAAKGASRLDRANPASRRAPAEGAAEGASHFDPATVDGLDGLAARAVGEFPGWVSASVRLPDDPSAPIAFTVLRGSRGRPDLRHQLTLARDGSIIESRSYSDLDRGRRVRSWLRWIHTGEAGGLVGQTIAGLASAATALLVWTGVSLSLRRLNSFLDRNRLRRAARRSRP